jgi:hypothetical protein
MFLIVLYFILTCAVTLRRRRPRENGNAAKTVWKHGSQSNEIEPMSLDDQMQFLARIQRNELEKTRINKLLKNDKAHDDWMMILFENHGSVVEEAFFNKATILSMTVWSVVTVLAKYDLASFPDVSEVMKAMGPVSSFLIFFAVFYCSQCYNRFSTQYFNCGSCQGRIYDTVSLCVTSLPHPLAVQVARYVNAAHILGYAGLGDPGG